MSDVETHGSSLGTSPKSLWEAEYSSGGIPSSVREEASTSVVDFVAHLRSYGLNRGTAIDVGCGSGRNAIYLAKQGFDVVALDYAQSQIDRLATILHDSPLSKKLKPMVGDVREKWPVRDSSVICAVDAFCFKHQISRSDVDGYVRSSTRAIQPGGFFMVSFAGRKDGYYSQFPVPENEGTGQVIRDPGNNILSRLYDSIEVASLFKDFAVEKSIVKENTNEMHGRAYPRETHVLYLRRK